MNRANVSARATSCIAWTTCTREVSPHAPSPTARYTSAGCSPGDGKLNESCALSALELMTLFAPFPALTGVAGVVDGVDVASVVDAAVDPAASSAPPFTLSATMATTHTTCTAQHAMEVD